MAQHLATIFGTEKDRVNCPFYFKIGYVASSVSYHRVVLTRVCGILMYLLSCSNAGHVGMAIDVLACIINQRLVLPSCCIICI